MQEHSQANEDNYPVPIATLELPAADMVKQSSGPTEKLDSGMFEWEEVVSSPLVSEKEREMPGLGPCFPDSPFRFSSTSHANFHFNSD